MLLSIAAAMLWTGEAWAASREVQYQPPAAWVVPPPAPTTTAASEGAPLRVVYTDMQTRLGKESDDSYFAYRVKILRPEALSAGNFAVSWSPNSDDFVVHRLNIIRDGKTIDVLATEKFKVIQRENYLDYAMLDGDLTATLQASGVQVGDEIEFAATIRRRDPTLGERSQGALLLPGGGSPGAYRMRLSWPKAKAVRWQATPDMGKLSPVVQGSEQLLTYELRDPASVVTAAGAPGRFNLRRMVQYSAFASWTEVSTLLWPLYDKAATLSPDSPIRAEAARIAAATKDPGERAAAALRLVQERIRYVYVGLDDANYRPASAEQTWTRRFGDCKAKTVLLIALLRELGIDGEPALVNSRGGDGMNEWLPQPAAFDHVLVRATIGGKTYWLDGTRMGDRTLASLPQPAFVWALPLRKGPVELTAVKAEAATRPQNSTVLQVDASAGFDVPAKVKAEQVLREDAALSLKTGVAGLTPEDAERRFKAYWRDQYAWVEPTAVSWRYDEDSKTLVLTMAGEGQPEWEGDHRRLNFEELGMSRPAPLKRPAEQDQAAPWKTDFPSFSRQTLVFRLPSPPAQKQWIYSGKPVRDRLGGVSYVRQAIFRENVLIGVVGVRATEPEVSPAEARDLNDRRLKFDDGIPMVYLGDPGPEAELSEQAIRNKIGADPKLLLGMGMSRLLAQRYDEAIAAFDAAIAADPKSIPAYAGKMEALRFKGDFDGAIALAAKLRQIAPGPTSEMMMVTALSYAGRGSEALPILDKLAATQPLEPWRMRDLARYYLAAGASDRAATLARRSLDAEPSNELGWLYLSEADAAAGRDEAALADIDKAIMLQPVNDTAHAMRSSVLRKQGKLVEALDEIDEAWRLNPLSPMVLNSRGVLLSEAGRDAEARALFDDWAATDKSGLALNGACWNRGVANVELTRAEADCAAAVKLAPKSAAIWDSYALIALRDGRLKEAVHRYDMALSFAPKHAPSLYGRGLAKLRAGEAAAGRADLAAAMAITPKAGDELNAAGLKP